MKKIILLLLFGLLALSACGREMWLKGEVIGRETDENGNLTAIVTETETHGIVRFLIAEDTVVDQLNGEVTIEDFLEMTLYILLFPSTPMPIQRHSRPMKEKKAH